MPAATRKSVATAQGPADDETAPAEAGSAAGAPQSPQAHSPEGPATSDGKGAAAEAAQDAAAQPPSGPVAVVFNRPLAMIVNGVGPCAPGETKHVPAPLAGRLTAGKTPLFTRATA